MENIFPLSLLNDRPRVFFIRSEKKLICHIQMHRTCIHHERRRLRVFLFDFDAPLFSDLLHHIQNDSQVLPHNRADDIDHHR